MKLNIEDTFNKELPADPIRDNIGRQVPNACFSYVSPRVPSSPELVHVSDEMLANLGLTETDKRSEEFLHVFSGTAVLEKTDPYAMCYGGHQFGTWAGQLGDGRAINLAEVVHNNERWAMQLKGAGRTPYSRSADGLAVLRSSVREHLCSEAMHHLGVPTTRSLSLMLNGDKVLRDMLYDGNSAYEKGAVVCRVANSFIRFGSFQIFAARRDTDNLKKLLDYTIDHLFPNIVSGTNIGYTQFFQEVTNRTLEMVIHWQRVGFVHGVMNTDNMSILGLTIDYGPYGWLEGYDNDWTPNTTDAQGKRYRFGNQPSIALWNLLQLANALVLVIGETKSLEESLDNYRTQYSERYTAMMRTKLGFKIKREADEDIILELEELLQLTEVDMTIFFRNISKVSSQMEVDDNGLFLRVISDAFYKPPEVKDDILLSWKIWFEKYINRLQEESISDTERQISMNKVNPKYVLRNYMAQMAIDNADTGDYSLISELHELLKKPYSEQKRKEEWFSKRPEWARNKVGCSMLSCSS